jgi:hypothetical protein
MVKSDYYKSKYCMDGEKLENSITGRNTCFPENFGSPPNLLFLPTKIDWSMFLQSKDYDLKEKINALHNRLAI